LSEIKTSQARVGQAEKTRDFLDHEWLNIQISISSWDERNIATGTKRDFAGSRPKKGQNPPSQEGAGNQKKRKEKKRKEQKAARDNTFTLAEGLQGGLEAEGALAGLHDQSQTGVDGFLSLFL
jgi:hypothetical protein